jgi:DNA-binding MarR family transcriptional regulator
MSRKTRRALMTRLCDLCHKYESEMQAEDLRRGMKPSFRNLMQIVLDHDNLSQLEIAKIAKVTTPTVSVALQSMEKAGFVERINDYGDKRVTRVRITKFGIESLRESIVFEANLQRKLLADLTAQEQKDLGSFIDRMADKLNISPPDTTDAEDENDQDE